MPTLRRARLVLAAAILASASFAVPAPVAAVGVISVSSGATQVAQAMATDSVVILPSTTWVARPQEGYPTGTAFGQIAGFGTSNYGVLSTGNVTQITEPTELGSTNLGGGPLPGRATVRDVTTLRIDFTTTDASANCLRFDFKFFSKEVPRNVGTIYNDAFLAQLDASAWTTNATSEVSSENNIGYGPGWRATSVNTSGRYMTAADARETVFDGSLLTGDQNGAATQPLMGMSPLIPGTTIHRLYLSLFDQVSSGGDSAVFVDGLRAETVANPASECAPPPNAPNPDSSPGAGAPVPFPGAGASLTLAARVTGGTASAGSFVLAATGPATIRGATGSAAVTAADLTVGSYVLSATGVPSTYATSWTCEGATLVGRTVALAPDAKATCTLLARYIDPFLASGTFVIADRGAKVGATVTYWSSAWSSRNAPSKGRTVTGFRGFAGSVSAAPPRAGATWRTTATVSAKPPRTLPRVIAVAVTSSVRKSGTRISGDIVRIVLIRRGGTFGVGKVIAVLSR